VWDKAGFRTGVPGYRHLLFGHRGVAAAGPRPGMAGHRMPC
jgi:hypothetical protein